METSAGCETKNLTFESHSEQCAGTLYLPSAGNDGSANSANETAKPPVIIMAHGFCAQRDFRLPAFAERFAAEGYASFIFDYRNFGDSTGHPRHWVSPRRHHQDWRQAISFVRTLNEIDPTQVILWGTSYSGGHVLQIASERPPIAAVIAQVPFVSGLSLLASTPPGRSLKLTAVALRDMIGGLFGNPYYTPAVGHPHEFAAMNTPECWDGWHAIMPPDTKWENKVTSRAFLTLTSFNPTFVVSKIAVPTLIVASKRDSITPCRLAEKSSKKIPNCKFVALNTNHFGPYTGEMFEQNIAAQIDFLKANTAT